MNTNTLEKIQIDLSSSHSKSYYEKYRAYLKEIEESLHENASDTYDFQGTSHINYERYVENNHIKR